jgi:hypothetical protein
MPWHPSSLAFLSFISQVPISPKRKQHEPKRLPVYLHHVACDWTLRLMPTNRKNQSAAYIVALSYCAAALCCSGTAHAEQPPVCKSPPGYTKALFRNLDGSLNTREYIGQSVDGSGSYKFSDSSGSRFWLVGVCGLWRTVQSGQPVPSNVKSRFEVTSDALFPLETGSTAATVRSESEGKLARIDWLVTRQVPAAEVEAEIPSLPGRVLEVQMTVNGMPEEVTWWSVALRSPVRWKGKNGYTNLVSYTAAPKSGEVSEPVSDNDGEAGGLLDVPSQ